jgi:hypothetical protein
MFPKFVTAAAIAGTLLIGAVSMMPAGAVVTSKSANMRNAAGAGSGTARLSFGNIKGWYGDITTNAYSLPKGDYLYEVSFTMADGRVWTSSVCVLHVGNVAKTSTCQGTANMLPGDWGAKNNAFLRPIVSGSGGTPSAALGGVFQ